MKMLVVHPHASISRAKFQFMENVQPHYKVDLFMGSLDAGKADFILFF